jgi:hypothetical protein
MPDSPRRAYRTCWQPAIDMTVVVGLESDMLHESPTMSIGKVTVVLKQETREK